MPGFEYRVIPAPRKPSKIKGVKGNEAKFAASLAEIMNNLGRDGWEYQRTDTLPCEERAGLTRKTTVFRNVLVFRRVIADEPVEMSVRTPTPVPRLAAQPVAQIEKQPEPAAPAPEPERAAETAAPLDLGSVSNQSAPTFRSAVASKATPALHAAGQSAPEGKAPRIGAAGAQEGNKPAPGVAAQ